MAYSYRHALGVSSADAGQTAASVMSLLASDGSLNPAALASRGIDLSDPKVYKQIEQSIFKAVDKMDLDIGSLIPAGTTVEGVDNSQLAPIVQAAVAGDISGVTKGLLATGATAGCVAATQGMGMAVCGTVVAAMTPVFAEIGSAVNDGVRSLFGLSTSSERAAKARAAEVAHEIGLFFDNLDKSLRSLEMTEATLFEQTRASAAVAFASVKGIKLPTTSKQVLTGLLRERVGQTADSAFDVNDPSGMTLSDYANSEAGRRNLDFVIKGPKGKEFLTYLAANVAPLNAARYRFNAENARQFWWRNMPPDQITVPGKKPVPLNYPTRNESTGRPYEPKCRIPAGDLTQTTFCGMLPCPAGWSFVASDSYIPVNYSARAALLADPRWNPNGADEATTIVDNWNWQWASAGRVTGDFRAVMDQLMPQVLAKQYERAACMINAHQRTYAALCKRALGSMLKQLVENKAKQSLSTARARSATYQKQASAQATKLGVLAAVAGIGVAGFIVWKGRQRR